MDAPSGHEGSSWTKTARPEAIERARETWLAQFPRSADPPPAERIDNPCRFVPIPARSQRTPSGARCAPRASSLPPACTRRASATRASPAFCGGAPPPIAKGTEPVRRRALLSDFESQPSRFSPRRAACTPRSRPAPPALGPAHRGCTPYRTIPRQPSCS